MLYPLCEDRPLLKDVVLFIAECAYPGIDRSRAVKRVRTAIRSEALHLVYNDSNGDQFVYADKFFTWAVTKKKWQPSLAQVSNLPLTSIEASSSIPLGDTGFISDVIISPVEKSALEEQFILCQSKERSLRSEVESLKLENENLKQRLSAYEEKEKRISLERSKSGKAGAGIPKYKT